MNHDLESLIFIWGPEVASDQIELGVGRRKLVFGAMIAKMQSSRQGRGITYDQ